MDVDLLIGIFPQVLLDGITLGFMYALIALGYTMVYGVLEFINFAHSEIFIFGAFVGVEILLSLRSAGVLDTLPWPLVLLFVLVAGMAISGALAVTVERIAYRPLRAAPRLIPLISAIGVSFFLQDLIRLVESVWRNAFNLVYPTMDVLNERFELTSTLDVSVKSLVVIVAALLMLWALHAIVNRTKVGTAIRAVAEDQAAASLMGINVNRIISLTFLIGGAMGGAAGVLFGVQYGLINPYSGFIPGLKAFTAAVLGGIGNIPGAMLGGLVLGLLEAFAAAYLSLLTGGAFGLTIVVGLAGLLDLGYVAFFAVGAYSWAILGSPHANVIFGGETFPLAGWWFYVFLFVGLGTAAITGILLGLPVLRLHGDYLAIVTLGFGEVIRVLAMVILGGMGSIPGAIVGATVVTVLNLQVLKGFSLWLNELKNAGVTIFGFSLADLPTQFEPAKYERMVFGIILVLMMIFRPQGIFPARRRQRELAS